MRPICTKEESGFTLPSILIASTLLSISLLAFIKILDNADKGQRGVASNIDLSDLRGGIRRVIDSRENCAHSGLVGIDVSPLLKQVPSNVEVRRILFPNGTPYVEAGVTSFGTRRVERMQLTSLIPTERADVYLASLVVLAPVTGKSTGPQKNMARFDLFLAVDPSTQVVESCGGCNWVFNGDSLSEICASRVGIGTDKPDRALHVATPSVSSEIVLEVEDGAMDHKKWNLVVDGGVGRSQNFSIRQLNDDASGVGSAGTPLKINGVDGGVAIERKLSVGNQVPVGGVNPPFLVSAAGDMIVNGGVDKRFAFYFGNVPLSGPGDPSLEVFSVTENRVDFKFPAFLSSPSDRRLKTQIAKLTGSLERVLSLSGVRYLWSDPKKYDDKAHLGVIAQEVEKVFPELVKQNSNGFLSVDYLGLIAPLIEAIRELYSTVVTLKEKQSILEAYLCQKDPDAPFCH